jgi:hypothetical protein
LRRTAGSPSLFKRCASVTTFSEILLAAAVSLTSMSMGAAVAAEATKVDRSGKVQTGEASFYGARHAGSQPPAASPSILASSPPRAPICRSEPRPR